MICHKQQSAQELTFSCFGCPCFVGFLDCLSDSPLGDGCFVVVAECGLWAVSEVFLMDLVNVFGGVLGIDPLVLVVLTEECVMAAIPLAAHCCFGGMVGK
jgi:hypothetical protein